MSGEQTRFFFLLDLQRHYGEILTPGKELQSRVTVQNVNNSSTDKNFRLRGNFIERVLITSEIVLEHYYNFELGSLD